MGLLIIIFNIIILLIIWKVVCIILLIGIRLAESVLGRCSIKQNGAH